MRYFPISMQIAKLMSMLMGIYLAWYLMGPIAAELARHAFEIFYCWRYGYLPSVWSIEYYTTFMPMRGHVTHYAYLYANKVCALILAPIFYKLPSLLSSCFKYQPVALDYLPSANDDHLPIDEAGIFLDNPIPVLLNTHNTKCNVNHESMVAAIPVTRLAHSRTNRG